MSTRLSNLKRLHKFGGSSLIDANGFKRVAEILKNITHPQDLVVVSAAGNTTNYLVNWLNYLNSDGRLAHKEIQKLRDYQTNIITTLLPLSIATTLLEQFEQEILEITNLGLNFPIKESDKTKIIGFGELWSIRLLTAFLNTIGIPAIELDARVFLRAKPGPQPQIIHDLSAKLLQEQLEKITDKLIIIPGFIATTENKEMLLLGRNGSDYSATVIGALVKVAEVIIWSDVAGVYSADPNLVNNTCLIPLLRLDEANELARLAAPVLHARTLQPVAQSQIELTLKSSYNPEIGSTHIERILATGRGAKIVTSLNDVCVIEIIVENKNDFSQINNSIHNYLAANQLTALAHNIQIDKCYIQYAYTKEMAPSVFYHLESLNLPITLEQKENYALIAAVGSGVTNNPVQTHSFFHVLEDLPVEFISHQEDKLSLVAILRSNITAQLLQNMHDQLFKAQKKVGIILCGLDGVSQEWINIFSKQQQVLMHRHGIEFALLGMYSRDKYWFNATEITLKTAIHDFNKYATSCTKSHWLEHVPENDYDDIVIIDATFSTNLAKDYILFAQQGYHVISNNKVAAACNNEKYLELKNTFAKTGTHWLTDATVGAGLPVNKTVRNLKESGDLIQSFYGIFSGTLSWLFLQYDGSIPFSQLVEQTWQQGLTEPDPRDDLNGKDVMRKLVILARESGINVEPSAVHIESLVTNSCLELDLDEFFENTTLDQIMLERFNKAKENNKVLRYVARLNKDGQAFVGIEELNLEHPLTNLLPCDNLFAIYSTRYQDNPLVIRGPGAGVVLTAGALHADLNRLGYLI